MALATVVMLDADAHGFSAWASTRPTSVPSLRAVTATEDSPAPGICVGCHTPIERERLRAIPGVTRCGGCTRQSPV